MSSLLIRATNKLIQNKIIKNMIKRAYEGAISSPSLSWNTVSTLSHFEEQMSLGILRERARKMVKNNSYAESAVSKISTNVIGTGIIPEFKGNFDQDIWGHWAESTDCDANGVLTYYGLQELVVRELVEAGECFIRKMQFGYDSFKGTIPLKLRLIPSEYIDTSKNSEPNGGSCISQGIEFDFLGRRVAYWMYPYNPRHFLGYRQSSIRIPAEEIIHIYKPKGADQVRGVTWFAPVLMDLKMSDNYQTAELKRKEQNASITGFLTSQDDVDPEDETLNINEEDTFYEKIRPGTILSLPNGKTITLTNPQSDSHYESFDASVLRKIAVGLNISYEVLTGDLSRVNFSSGRMGFIEFQRQLESWRWNLAVPMFCSRISQWFLESASLVGYDTSKITHIDYTAPHREMIDPVRETAAIISSIRAGLKSHKEAVKELGYNPQKLYDEIAEVNAILDAKKIILDSDPRATSQQGILQNVLESKKQKSIQKNKVKKTNKIKKGENKNADRSQIPKF